MIRKVNANNGFTLVEVLFVLAVLSILVLITPKLNVSSLQEVHEQQFFQTLESDVLYIQNLTPTTTNNIRIRLYEDNYTIYDGNKIYAIRRYPKYLTVNTREKHTLEFKKAGTVIQPRTIVFSSNDSEYRVVFPLGKGRFYIVED